MISHEEALDMVATNVTEGVHPAQRGIKARIFV
jgi:hypothetical protein